MRKEEVLVSQSADRQACVTSKIRQGDAILEEIDVTRLSKNAIAISQCAW